MRPPRPARSPAPPPPTPSTTHDRRHRFIPRRFFHVHRLPFDRHLLQRAPRPRRRLRNFTNPYPLRAPSFCRNHLHALHLPVFAFKEFPKSFLITFMMHTSDEHRSIPRLRPPRPLRDRAARLRVALGRARRLAAPSSRSSVASVASSLAFRRIRIVGGLHRSFRLLHHHRASLDVVTTYIRASSLGLVAPSSTSRVDRRCASSSSSSSLGIVVTDRGASGYAFVRSSVACRVDDTSRVESSSSSRARRRRVTSKSNAGPRGWWCVSLSLSIFNRWVYCMLYMYHLSVCV